MVTGHGAGFVMCWQNDVQLSIAEDDDPKNFMVVKSGSYVLAIPDLNHYARQETDAEATNRPETSSSGSSRKQLAAFKKTVMKLNGNVRWGVGLVFERNLDDGERSFEFIPHHHVTLKNPKYATPSNGKVYITLPKMAWTTLKFSRSMTLFEASAVIIFICLLLSLLPTIVNGLLPTWSRQKHTIVYILHLVFSPTSTVGGLCSRAQCLCLSGRANCGLGLKSLARSLEDIWRLSSTIYCFRRCT